MHATDPRFEAWLLRETGIDASALGISTLERAVLERVRSLGAHDPAANDAAHAVEAYWQLLNTSPEEKQALVEGLVVPETWFFRDREAFVALARLANERLVREPSRVLRVLSAPCSSGEEPYSVAMALLDAGIGAERFVIDALDISARAIQLAQRAIYGRNSFRGGELAFRDRHFASTEGGWALSERVRDTVRLLQANLFDAPDNPDARYDFIFCRNVLIYFNREAQDRTVQLLDAQLADGGTIFVGPAETGMMMRHALSSARIPLAFAFQRTPPEELAAQRAAPLRNASFAAASAGKASQPGAAVGAGYWHAAKKAPPLAGAARATTQPGTPAATRPAVKTAAAPRQLAAAATGTDSSPSPSSASLADARRLADAGRLDEAEREAHAFAILHGPDAEAFYLLGLIADARSRSADAIDYYRKVLYLEPGHYEALTQLAALLDMNGDSTGAQQLMRRAQRAATRAASSAQASSAAGHLNPLRGFHGSRRR
ncbi:CheR family methyltransferase [Paraburkholderia sp.]|uniref:CheR family methyltransferase n=1 Tax=Paraburkholderia sp. TaxID=1926495 RepID=UPI002F42E452